MNCFVIIGYGKKPSYASSPPRQLDLDKTYKNLIKPVFNDLGIDCYRAIDKNLNGSIDQVMLEGIKNAEIVLADISTLNANVMWELGVRHALKPHHTIMICEKEQMSNLPFDVNHFVVHSYLHSGEDIFYDEVERFRSHLRGIVSDIKNQQQPKTDSPVYQILKNLPIPLTSETTTGLEGVMDINAMLLRELFSDISVNGAEGLMGNSSFTLTTSEENLDGENLNGVEGIILPEEISEKEFQFELKESNTQSNREKQGLIRGTVQLTTYKKEDKTLMDLVSPVIHNAVVRDSKLSGLSQDSIEKNKYQKTEELTSSKSIEPIPEESFVSIMKKAENAKESKNYEEALRYFAIAKEFALKNMTLRDNLPFIISREALCTYKSENPPTIECLNKAKTILEELHPLNSSDIEVLGLSGAIHKRLYEVRNDKQDLDAAITFYKKGFQLKQDYYNGINAAFMLYVKASKLKESHDEELDDVKLDADVIRNATLKIALGLEAQSNFNDLPDAIWILLTIAEAYISKNNEAKIQEYERKAEQYAKEKNDSFSLGSYQEQKNKYPAILTIFNTEKTI